MVSEAQRHDETEGGAVSRTAPRPGRAKPGRPKGATDKRMSERAQGQAVIREMRDLMRTIHIPAATPTSKCPRCHEPVYTVPCDRGSSQPQLAMVDAIVGQAPTESGDGVGVAHYQRCYPGAP